MITVKNLKMWLKDVPDDVEIRRHSLWRGGQNEDPGILNIDMDYNVLCNLQDVDVVPNNKIKEVVLWVETN